jgi:hypothetical protein
MNMTIILPKRTLTLSQWLCKHKVSTNICSLDEVVMRAVNSTHYE